MPNFELAGMDELLNRLSQIGRNIDGTIEDTLIEAGNNVKEEMQRLVPVSSISHKHIRDDIAVSSIKGEGTGKFIEIGPGKDTNWRANFLEFGTKKMSAKPFIEPAHLQTRQENKEIIKRRIKGALGL